MALGKSRSGMSYTQARARAEYLLPFIETQRQEQNEYRLLLRQFPKLRTLYRRQPKAKMSGKKR